MNENNYDKNNTVVTLSAALGGEGMALQILIGAIHQSIFFYNRRFICSVISTTGRDPRLKDNQDVKIDEQWRNLRTHIRSK
jgi:hypothetical protein